MIIFKRLLRFYLWQVPNDGQISRGGNRNNPLLLGQLVARSNPYFIFLFGLPRIC